MTNRRRGPIKTERRGAVPVDPETKCKSGKHFRTPENTGTASTGRHFCRRCKYEAEKEREQKSPKARPAAAKAKDVILTPFEIEAALRTVPCMSCGAVPTRRGVGEDGQPRWLAAPKTAHRPGCSVGARREIVQRNRSKSKGEAA